MTNNSRTYVLSGSASGIGRATKELLESQGHRVIGVDLRNADVIADLGTPAGRDVMIDEVTKKSGGQLTRYWRQPELTSLAPQPLRSLLWRACDAARASSVAAQVVRSACRGRVFDHLRSSFRPATAGRHAGRN
jgi:NAD(P)-dependent dehydrogenase (short-subunit alcohol dehydrogenase family)